MYLRQPRSSRFPYTTLFRSPFERSQSRIFFESIIHRKSKLDVCWPTTSRSRGLVTSLAILLSGGALAFVRLSSSQDRKSTRLNSSHANISYAVFCLKKKIQS